MKCQLCRGGLFIPLNDHIELYCQTLHYPQCEQFSLHSSPHLQTIGNAKPNRRKYERMAMIHQVTLTEFEKGISAASYAGARLSPAIARTFSLSKGGMGIITEHPLPRASVVRFAFENSFPESIQCGEGRIAWLSKRQTSQYRAGIAFQNHRYIETMGLYLGLISTLPSAAGE